MYGSRSKIPSNKSHQAATQIIKATAARIYVATAVRICVATAVRCNNLFTAGRICVATAVKSLQLPL
jgi:hypothetical protein